MLLKVDHYASLSRAVSRLERDSYGARGAVYDLALLTLIRRLQSEIPPPTQEEIDRELFAFRQAVRRVEFGDMDSREWPANESARATVRQGGSRRDLTFAAVDGPSEDAQRLMDAARHGSVLRRVARRAALAVLLIAVGIVGYAQATGKLDLSELARLVEQLAAVDWPGQAGGSVGDRSASAAAGERAAYYELQASDQTWRQVAGKALWRTSLEATGAGRNREAVLILDVEIPESGLSLEMSMRRDTSGGAAMSHLVELKFAGSPSSFSVDQIATVKGIGVRNVDDRNGTPLVGQSAKVAPGLFLIGLPAEKDVARRNIELLQRHSRLDIPIVLADGKTAVIAVEKGASGDRAFTDVLAKWNE
jgi:hypothetical protein